MMFPFILRAERDVVSTRRRVLMFVLELLILCLMLPSHGLEAAQRTATQAPNLSGMSDGARLTVYVRDENGSSFEGLATVSLQHLTTQNLASGPTTSGRAVFDQLGPGEYTVVVTAPGYLTASERVSITLPNQQEQLFITLRRDNDSMTTPAPTGPPILSPKLQKELSKTVEALQANNLDAAQKHLDAAYRLGPANPEVNYMRGVLADRQGNVASAEASWEKTVSLDPKHNLALLGLATIHTRRGDYAGGKTYLERVLQNDPNSWHAHQLFSIICLRQGDYQDAVSHAERSLELGKNLANSARLTLAAALIAQNQRNPAEGALQAFLAARPPQAQAAVANRMLENLRSGALSTERARADNSIRPAENANVFDLPLLKPDLPKWLPANVDDSIPSVEADVSCPLQEILASASSHVLEFTRSIDRITATETLDHQVVNEWGFPIREEKRSFDYVVSISTIRERYLAVQEYRNGTQDLGVFPDAVATVGLPAAVLVFHPYYRDDYEMKCEGLGRWKGGMAWQIHFAQKAGKSSQLRGYRAGVNAPSVPIALKGRAWIDKNTLQVVRIETDLQAPMPEIKYLAEHMDIEYGAVKFHKQDETIWLPMTADIYFELRGRRIRRTNVFQKYLLFSVDEKQNISAPKDAAVSGDTLPVSPGPLRP
jgi:tetratricopeptide (TPR) repeat protein